MEFYIKKNSTLPILKMEIIKDGRSDYNYNSFLSGGTSFLISLFDNKNDTFLFASKECYMTSESSPFGDETTYYLNYQFSNKETLNEGRYEVQISIPSENGVILLPLQEKFYVNILDSFANENLGFLTKYTSNIPCCGQSTDGALTMNDLELIAEYSEGSVIAEYRLTSKLNVETNTTISFTNTLGTLSGDSISIISGVTIEKGQKEGTTTVTLNENYENLNNSFTFSEVSVSPDVMKAEDQVSINPVLKSMPACYCVFFVNYTSSNKFVRFKTCFNTDAGKNLLPGEYISVCVAAYTAQLGVTVTLQPQNECTPSSTTCPPPCIEPCYTLFSRQGYNLLYRFDSGLNQVVPIYIPNWSLPQSIALGGDSLVGYINSSYNSIRVISITNQSPNCFNPQSPQNLYTIGLPTPPYPPQNPSFSYSFGKGLAFRGTNILICSQKGWNADANVTSIIAINVTNPNSPSSNKLFDLGVNKVVQNDILYNVLPNGNRRIILITRGLNLQYYLEQWIQLSGGGNWFQNVEVLFNAELVNAQINAMYETGGSLFAVGYTGIVYKVTLEYPYDFEQVSNLNLGQINSSASRNLSNGSCGEAPYLIPVDPDTCNCLFFKFVGLQPAYLKYYNCDGDFIQQGPFSSDQLTPRCVSDFPQNLNPSWSAIGLGSCLNDADCSLYLSQTPTPTPTKTPTPNVTPTHTPTPTQTPSQTNCILTSNPIIVPNNNQAQSCTQQDNWNETRFSVFSQNGSVIYGPNWSYGGTGSILVNLPSISLWKNICNDVLGWGCDSGPLYRSGRLPQYTSNYSSFYNKWYGMRGCFTVSNLGFCLIGLGGSSRFRLKIDGEILIDSNSSNLSTNSYLRWNIYPLYLTPGNHSIEVAFLYNDTNGDPRPAIGCEVYSNTVAQLNAATNYNDLNVVYTTQGELFFEFIENSTTGAIIYSNRTCPVGYTFNPCTNECELDDCDNSNITMFLSSYYSSGSLNADYKILSSKRVPSDVTVTFTNTLGVISGSPIYISTGITISAGTDSGSISVSTGDNFYNLNYTSTFSNIEIISTATTVNFVVEPNSTFPTPTATPTYTSTPTSSIPVTITPTRTTTSTPNPTNTLTSTNTPTPSVTNTLTPSITPTNTQTSTNTPTPSVTNTLTPSITPTNTQTPSITNTITPTKTPTPSITLTNTPTQTNISVCNCILLSGSTPSDGLFSMTLQSDGLPYPDTSFSGLTPITNTRVKIQFFGGNWNISLQGNYYGNILSKSSVCPLGNSWSSTSELTVYNTLVITCP